MATVTIPKPRVAPESRNSRRDPAEPAWCVDHNGADWAHRSKPVVVGDRRNGGQVTVWLEQTPGGKTRVGLNAAHLTGLSIEVPPSVAGDLVAVLVDLLQQAGINFTAGTSWVPA